MPPTNSDSPRAAAHAAMDAERQRVAAIMSLPEAAGECRPLAEYLAVHDNRSVEWVQRALQAAWEDINAEAAPSEPAQADAQSWSRGWDWNAEEGFVRVAPAGGPDPAWAAYESTRLAGGGIRPVSIHDHPTPSTQEPDEQDD